jgi:hypothetical protein
MRAINSFKDALQVGSDQLGDWSSLAEDGQRSTGVVEELVGRVDSQDMIHGLNHVFRPDGALGGRWCI